MNNKGFKAAIAAETPLQVVGTINAYSAIQAKQQGFKAIYLSGAGVANASYGLPDLGMTGLADVLEDVRRITNACDLPVLVDIDTGWGHALTISRAIKEMIAAGAAAVHIEDQVGAKRCGHRPNKAIVSQQEMVDRVKAAVDAVSDPDFAVMARTDALAVEGMQSAIDRALACIEAGASMIFPEAVTSLEEYQIFCREVQVPVLANITEFGKTPLFTRQQLADVGVQLMLYPLTAFRMMSQAALTAYQTIKAQGSQASLIDTMQPRDELYQTLNYYQYEAQIDKLNQKQS